MIGELKLEELTYFDFLTHHPSTQAVTDADSGPTAEVFEDDTDTTVVALTVTKRTSKTGNYRCPVTAAAASGFEVGKTYNVVASATVNSITGKGRIGQFKVRARGKDDLAFPLTSGRAIDITAANKVNGVVLVDTVTTYTGNTPQTGDSFARIGALGAGLTAVGDTAGTTTLLSRLSAVRAGYLDNLSAGAAALQSSLSSLITTVGAAGAGLTATATAVWAVAVRVLTAGTNIILPANAITRASFAADTGLQSIRSFTAQAGGVSTITFDVGADATDNFYNDTAILLTGGTGAGQYAVILDYVGATKVATIDAPWVVVPDNTTTAAVFPGPASGTTTDAIWDESLSAHVIVGSAGAALAAAGSAGDPWSTPLPGAYGAGTAGSVLAARSTQTSVDDLPTNAELAAAVPTALQNADALLKRDMSAVTGEAARSLLNVMRFQRNKFTIVGATLTVYKEDDTTVAWTATIATTAGDPVSSSDPA